MDENLAHLANLAYDPNVIAANLQQSLDVRFGLDRAGRSKIIVTPRWSGPQIDVFTCLLAHGVRVELFEGMAATLGVAAGVSEACRISRVDGALLLEIPKPERLRLPLRAERLEAIAPPAPTAAPLGLTTGGKLLWLDLADERQAHILIGGITQSGKSTLLKWLLYRWLAQCSAGQLALIAADPKINNVQGLQPFRHAMHLLHPIQRDASEVVRLLTWVLCEMERREALNITTPRLLVVLEEVAHFTDQSKQVAPLLNQIMKTAAGWHINVLATTQHPGAKSLGDAIVNFSATIIGRVARGTQVFGATGRKGTAADELLMRGDMLYIGAGETIRFQAPLADDRQWRRVRRGGPRSLDDQLPRADRIALALPKSNPTGRVLTPGDVERVRAAVLSGQSVNYVRQALGIGTDRARELHASIRAGRV